MALRRVKLLKSLLVGAIVGFAVAASYTTSLVAERQDALRQVWRYNTAWLASQAVVEFMRFEQRVSAFEIQGSGVGQDEVQLRLDILFNRLKLLKEGDFEEFVRHDPERRQIIDHLGAVLAAVQPLIDSPDRPGAAQTALKMLSPLDGKLVSLASAANRSGGDRVAEDQHELIRLHWFFTSLVVGLILFGVALVGMLARHNRDIERAHDALRTLAGSLQRTSSDLETANRHFGAALNNMSQGLCMVDGRQRLIVCNQRFLDMFGLAADAVEPGTLAHDLFDRIVAGGQYAESVLRSVQDGQQQLVREGRAAGFFQEGEDGRSIAVAHESMADGGWVATYEDITERRRAEAQIAYMAHHDSLTDLANRVLFREHVEQALARARRYDEGFAVICLDLDRFKDVNDTLGHPVGDMLLKAVADRLRGCVRESDVVARLGGDEFAVLEIGSGLPSHVGILAGRIVEALGAPFDLDGHEVVVGASLGVAVAPADGADPDQLLKNADMALYRAKADGRGIFRFFEPGMDARLQERRALEVDLRTALANGEFDLFYQPLINAGTSQISGFEALLRWRHPGRGMVPPAEFIPVAEEIGLIAPLGEWVLRQACREAAWWPADIRVAINLSPAQFRSRNLVQVVASALVASSLSPGRLELEITESVLLHDNESTLAVLHQLRALGVRIAMDDFGTGYSSLSYLLSFPFDRIKIDRSFVRDISERADCAAIVQSIASLGASLGMATTAEGVETGEQLQLLKAVGCTEVQGYYFARPQPAGEARRLLENRASAAA